VEDPENEEGKIITNNGCIFGTLFFHFNYFWVPKISHFIIVFYFHYLFHQIFILNYKRKSGTG
jgi:hypothetical protein